MASAMAATCMLLRPPPCAASASPLPMIPSLRRRPRSLTTACAVVTTQQQQQGAVQKQQQNGAVRSPWTAAPVSAITPATEDQSMFLITLDLSGAPDLVATYTTPGQSVLTRVPSPRRPPLRPAFMCISSAPHSGLQFDLLVRSVPGTTSEQLCKLHVGDVVEIGPVTGTGFAIQNINPPEATQTVLLVAVAEGISPIRALIESGFSASERADVRLYYAANMQAMPYQERFKNWEDTGVKVVPLPRKEQKIQEPFLEHTLNGIIRDPLSTGAVIVGPPTLKEVITGILLDNGVPQEKILTIEWNPDIEPSTLDLFGLNGLGQAPTMDAFAAE